MLAELPGVDVVLDRDAQAAVGLDHERSGELIAVAEPDAWFTYYYWLDDAVRPTSRAAWTSTANPATTRPSCSSTRPTRWPRPRPGVNLARKKLGLRYAMNVVPLDPSCVRGTHGRLPDVAADGPVLLCSDPVVPRSVERDGRLAATDVRDFLLGLQGISTR